MTETLRQGALQLAIAAHALSKQVGGRLLFRDFDLSVPHGSIHAVLGPPGAGKSVLLRMLATLEPPDGGNIVISGVPTDVDLERARRHIGYMPQLFVAYDGMTAATYLDFYAAAQCVNSRDRNALRSALLELLDLGAMEHHAVHSLPVDQRQRLSLARCLIHDPVVLLLDDPAADMSEQSQAELGATLRDLSALGKTVLLTGRTDGFASTVCSSVSWLQDHVSSDLAPVGEWDGES